MALDPVLRNVANNCLQIRHRIPQRGQAIKIISKDTTTNNGVNVQKRKLELRFWKHLREQNKLPVELCKPPSSGRPEAYLTVHHSARPVRTLGKKTRSISIHFFKHKYISNFQQNLPHNPLFFQLVHMQEYRLQSIS